MSVVAYGAGTPANPQIVFSHARTTCRREVVYDGPAMLFTRWTLAVSSIYDPAATAYETAGDPADNTTRVVLSPLRGAGAFGVGQGEAGPPRARVAVAPVTDAAIRDALARPRQRLVYTTGVVDVANAPNFLVRDRAGGQQSCLVVESPYQPGNRGERDTRVYAVDVDNGPKPIGNPIIRVDGTGTKHVQWTVQFCTREEHLLYKPPILLSHVWDMAHDIDVFGFTTRVTTGRVVFRSDVLAQQAVTPDDFRKVLIGHPVPTNFRRENVRVQAETDPNKLRYTVVDREKSHNILWPNVTRVEAFYTLGTSHESTETSLTNFATGYGGAWRDFGRSALNLDISGILGAGWRGLSASANLPVKAQPQVALTVLARVWGNRNAARRSLLAAANVTLHSKVPFVADPARARGGLYERQYSYRTDLMGRYAEAVVSVKVPPITNFLAQMLSDRDSIEGDALQRFPQLFNDELGRVATTGDRAGRSFVDDRIDRGTYLENAVAQALWDGRVNPPAPTATPRTQDKVTLAY